MSLGSPARALAFSLAATCAPELACQDLRWRAEGVGGQIGRGRDVHRLGDYDHDGWDDLLERVNILQGHYIRTAIYITSGRDGSVLSAGAPIPNLFTFGNIAPLGDMNQDGVLDYGAHYYDAANPQSTQRLAVFSGATHTILWSAWIPNAWGTYFAAVLAGGLDVNGDGRKDVVTSASALSPGGTILVYDNSGVELYRVVDPVPNCTLGIMLAPLDGDLDGDGCGDFLASGNEPQGRGIIVCFSGRTGAILRTSFGQQTGDALLKLWPCGDIDQDGVPDYRGGGSAAAVVTAFSGATGQVIHSWRDPQYCCTGVQVTGGADLDSDGVPDLLASAQSTSAPFDRLVATFSGRDGTLLARWNASANFYTCFGECVAVLGPGPGDPYGVAVFAERCWGSVSNPCTFNSLCPGAVYAYRACPKGVRTFGTADASSNQPLAQSGMRSPPAASPTVRFTVSSTPPGAVCVLQIGLSNQSLQGLPLPAPLDPMGFPGITLLNSWEATLCTVAGTVGVDAGYAAFDVRLPPGRVIDTSGTPMHAQWIWFDPTNTANHGSTAGQRFLLR